MALQREGVRSLRTLFLAGAAIFLLLIAAAGYALVQEWRAAVTAHRWVEHTYEAIDQIRRMFDDVQDAETSVRGYYINGDPVYLEPYTAAAEGIEADMAKARAVAGDNPVQQRNMDRMEPLTREKFHVLGGAVQKRREAGTATYMPPRDPTAARHGRELMDDIRGLVSTMIDEEHRLLTVRIADQERSTRSNLALVVATFIVGVLSFGLAGILGFGYVQRRRESEAAIAAQAALLAATFDNISQGVSVFGRDLRLLAWNQRFVEFNKLKGGDLEGVDLATLMRRSADRDEITGDQEQWIAERLALAASRQPHRMERLRPDGTVLDIRSAFTSEGFLVTTHADVTAMKTVERDLRANMARLNAVFDTALDGIVTINPSGSIESFSPAAERIFGYSSAEVLGRNISILMPEPYASAHDGYLRHYFSTGEARILGKRRELEAKHRDGTLFPIELSVNEVHLGDRRIFVGMVRDISERRKVERMKNEFVSTVSHELRTPLTSIAGSLGLLEASAAGALPDAAKRLVQIAHRNSERLVRLVNDILDLEKIESGRVTFSIKPIALLPFIAASLEANRAYADQFRVRFAMDAKAQEAVVLADTDRMSQVLTNLLSNAVKFSPPEAEVEIGVVARDETVRIFVRDHGPGIPDEFRSSIFQKFAQADASDSRKRGGTGLGLSIVASIVERLGGQVSFESVPGQGSTFFVDLPLWREGIASAGDAAALEPVEPLAASRRIRILHVEDDADVRGVVKTALRDFAEVLPAPNLAAAKIVLAGGKIDLVVLDMSLPDGAGTSLLPLAPAANGKSIPVVLFSSQDAEDHVGGPVEAVLVKSKASTAELVRHVRALTGRAETETVP